MAPRVLVCIEDHGVANVVAARLLKDGVDGVVVDKPSRLVEEAKRGVAALALQDRYPTGEAATSLLRQIRVARSEAVPAIVLLTGDIPQGDRLVLEKQYKVREFMRTTETPQRIATAVGAAAGRGDDVEIDESNGFDISIDSVVAHIGEFSDDDALAQKTLEVSSLEMRRKHAAQGAVGEIGSDEQTITGAPNGALLANSLTSRVGRPPRPETKRNGIAPVTEDEQLEIEKLDTGETSEALVDLTHIPPPGGDADVQLRTQSSVVLKQPSPLGDKRGPAPRDPRPPNRAPTPVSAASPATPAPSDPGNTPRDEGELVQTQSQDLQKAQTELKKALIAERKAREAAQRRVEELEAKLAKVGDPSPKFSGGVPSEGVFEDIRYPALLARCRSEAFTGAIVMQSSGATRNVYLKDGLPVAFHSSEPGERIGKVLVTQGRISDAQYMQATTRSVERSIKLTDALVELGWMDAETIAVEQRNLARDQIIQSFELVQGRFTVQSGVAPDSNTATFDFGPGEIYVQGYRRYAPSSEMMAAYETLRDKFFIANARLASYRPKLGLTGEDERLLRLLGEALVIEEAVERANVSPEASARLLSALLALELIEEWSPGVEQFRGRIRAEKQRTAEEISNILAEARQREHRMLEAFERALSKLGGGSLGIQLEPEPRAGRPNLTGASSAASTFGSSSLASSNASASASPLAAPTAPASPASSSAMPAASARTGSAGTMMGVGAATSVNTNNAMADREVAAPAPAPAAKSARDSQSSLTVADVKYREGVDQAAANRLDEAEVTLREAVRLDASKPEYLTALARVLLGNPRYERAGTLPVVRSLLDRAVQIAPDFQEANDLHAQVVKEMST